nr:MAG TPA: hypothetical protein [Caudoviricetes sp.]
MNRFYVMIKDERHSKHYNYIVNARNIDDAKRIAFNRAKQEKNHGKEKGLLVYDAMLCK